MKTLTKYISHVKDLHSLNEYLNEKLIVNKDYTNIDSLEEMFDNVDFKRIDDNELDVRDDIFSIMIDYIRDHNIRSFSDFDSYRNTCRENNNVCLAIFNKHIEEIDIFQKISNDSYKVFIIYRRYSDRYMFNEYERRITSMHCLNKSNTWTNVDEVEYYEISKETFDDISELYNKLIKK